MGWSVNQNLIKFHFSKQKKNNGSAHKWQKESWFFSDRFETNLYVYRILLDDISSPIRLIFTFQVEKKVEHGAHKCQNEQWIFFQIGLKYINMYVEFQIDSLFRPEIKKKTYI